MFSTLLHLLHVTPREGGFADLAGHFHGVLIRDDQALTNELDAGFQRLDQSCWDLKGNAVVGLEEDLDVVLEDLLVTEHHDELVDRDGGGALADPRKGLGEEVIHPVEIVALVAPDVGYEPPGVELALDALLPAFDLGMFGEPPRDEGLGLNDANVEVFG